jgi:valyl-tRNA synthetase
MIDQRFNPKDHEQRIYQRWEEAGCFKPSGDTSAQAYSVMIPPPNVTGSLHMGHALNHTVQDILCRFERMRGKNVLWQPGMDHAGIATQMVVERKLAAEGNQSRRDMGRDAFINKVWEWKEESGGQILEQDKRLGSSMDWSRTKFTLDDDMAEVVTKVFVDLYNDGLIYRDKRLVNWDPHFETAISDLEVETKEVDGHYWHLRYPLADGVTYEHPAFDEEGEPAGTETRNYLVVATSRPETMLGDTCVAVHPDDERYKGLVGKFVDLPIVGRRVPIVADEYADPEKGSGAVKITPAHDFNDFEVGKRAGADVLNILTSKAAIVGGDEAEAAGIPEQYIGLDRFEARKAIVTAFDELGFLQEIEKLKIEQPVGDRSGSVVEPWLTDQWYVDAATLAKPALEAVQQGKTKFVPENWDKTYYNWMNDIQPWCVSRQLWWGHRIPVWYGPNLDDLGRLVGDQPLPFCEQTSDGAFKEAEFTLTQMSDPLEEVFRDRAQFELRREQLKNGNLELVEANDRVGLTFATFKDADQKLTTIALIEQDADVLDTWFSSALWPFSTQGWPNETDNLKAFYPSAVLVTAFDIIFFWVARMMMMGIKFMDGEVPFKDVYIHAIVRDENGKKMSKSEGNVIDPVDLIDGIDADALVAKRTTGLRQPEKAPQVEKETRKKYPKGFEAYGADALRFTLAAMATKGRDINLAVDRVAGYRNFGTKLWNATRFAQMNEATFGQSLNPQDLELSVNKWIVSELYKSTTAIVDALEEYRFNDAAAAIYKFTWDILCDWYLELSKPVLMGDDEAAKAETRLTLGWVLEQTYAALHPFSPFITETLWEQTGERGDFLMQQTWPGLDGGWGDEAAADEMNWVLRTISEIRSVRSNVNVPASAKVPVSLLDANDETAKRVEAHRDVICRMARLDKLALAKAAPDGAVKTVVDEATLVLEVAEFIDTSAEVERLSKTLDKLHKEIGGLSGRLGNEAFVAKAPPEVVAEQRIRLAELRGTRDKLSAAREQLSS